MRRARSPRLRSDSRQTSAALFWTGSWSSQAFTSAGSSVPVDPVAGGGLVGLEGDGGVRRPGLPEPCEPGVELDLVSLVLGRVGGPEERRPRELGAHEAVLAADDRAVDGAQDVVELSCGTRAGARR